MNYDVEADFYVLTTCNFRCGFCFIPLAALGAPILRKNGGSSFCIQWQRPNGYMVSKVKRVHSGPAR